MVYSRQLIASKTWVTNMSQYKAVHEYPLTQSLYVRLNSLSLSWDTVCQFPWLKLSIDPCFTRFGGKSFCLTKMVHM